MQLHAAECLPACDRIHVASAAVPTAWLPFAQAATEALQTETMEMGKAMYSQPGAAGPDPSAAGAAPGGDSGAGSSSAGGADNVVDAEFTESDDRK